MPNIITRSLRGPETQKYAAMWAESAYHAVSPGVDHVEMFLSLVGDRRGSLLDIGCGTGRAGTVLAARGFDVTLLDFIPVGVQDDLPFYLVCLWDDWPARVSGDVGYCCDVLEHIPTEFVGLVIANVLRACPRAFFTVSNQPDLCGRLIGQSLHLSVENFQWWRDRFAELGTLIDARDLLGTSAFYVARRES